MYQSNRMDYFSLYKLYSKLCRIECVNTFDDFSEGLIDWFQFCLYISILRNILLLTAKDHRMVYSFSIYI